MQLNRRALMTTALGLAGLAAAAPAKAAQTVKVRIPAARTAFEPAEVKIKVGDTVEWSNRGAVIHTVTFDPAKAKDKSHVQLPAGVQPFGSGEIGEDGTYSHTFTAKGTYKYVCVEHEAMGMVGSVIVE